MYLSPGNKNANTIKVTLRQREKGNKISLYLDYYNQGKRTYEYLDLFLYPMPEKGRLTKVQRDHNRSNLELAKSIWAKKHLNIQNGLHGFADESNLKASFLDFRDANWYHYVSK